MSKFPLISNFMQKKPDGGPASPVEAYFAIEMKGFFSVAVLKFHKGGREAYHSHAFNALTWFIKGDMVEEDVDGATYKYKRRLSPKLTRRTKNHRVKATTDSWCLTLRGPWQDTWNEVSPHSGDVVTLTHGRKVVYPKPPTAPHVGAK